ncbi:hypothetical protein L1987_53632 [Smallanthus sonchifolius]|uniref:Uncharacterized protein n=1 Tax=Smallanthus sonchifolius TaxID=185202 RepID=A0ACB9EXM7_9ASTR|nr:hypothetical protein L1987_53632 [Smallanthus sonchifolius]
MGSSSSVKEIFQADISTEVGKGKEREVEDSLEVREVFPKGLQTVTGKEIDSVLKEIDDAFKLSEIELGEKDSEINENNEGDELSDISFGEDLQMDMEKNVANGTSGMEESMDEESENNKEKYISPKEKDPICLDTDEKVKEGESKKKGIPTCDKTTKGKIVSKRIREMREKKETLSKEKDRLPDVLLGGYVKGCKKRWKSNDRSVPFSGPLAILTLLYVDSIECKGIKMDKNTIPISFWNMSRLKERQKWEIENGGFGKGKFKRLSKVVVDEDEGNIGYFVGDEIEVLEKLLDVLQKQKNVLDSKLEDCWKTIQNNRKRFSNSSTSNDGNVSENDNYGDNEKNDKEETDKEGENDTSADKEGENDTFAGVEQDQQEKPGDSGDIGAVDHDQQQPEDTEENAGEENDNVQAKEGNTEEEKTNEIVYDAPPFSIGLTQLESNNKELDTGKEKVDSQQRLSVTKEADGSTLHQNKSEYVYDGPPFSIGLTQLESQYGADETKQIEESKMEKRFDEVESSDIREAITKEEEPVWEYLFKEDGMMYKLLGKKKRKLDDEETMKGKGKVVEDEESETVFRNNFNLEVEKFRFKTLKYDTKVFNKVIDAWVDVLKYEEKYRSPTSPYRLFCDTDLIFDWMLKELETNWTKRMERFILNMNRAVYWNLALMDLRGIDMVFMPMLEHDHYYLIVFELKHIAISVIDNFSDAYPLVRLDDHENYFEKDLSYKVVRI